MFGQQIAPTDYDLRFRCFGFPVRVNPWFWLVSAMLYWSEKLDYTLLGIVAAFVSILVHELGHAFANRYYGGRSEIVLYYFGGYATRTVNPSRLGNILIFAAGPVAGLLLGGTVWLLARQFPQQILGRSEHRYHFVRIMLLFNIYWSLMNFLPVWPLDGGQIAHEVIGRFRAFDAWVLTLKLSILVCAGIFSWCAFEYAQRGDGDRFLMIMFGLLGVQNFLTLQASTRGRW